MGLAQVAQEFIHRIELSERKVIVNISSAIGSITTTIATREETGPVAASYCVSKVALNMLVSIASNPL
jgi:NAD(P)-dependent dehydrogenase (short-subunit alcohol dehydrogenase family)